jgi:hypothetical protein
MIMKYQNLIAAVLFAALLPLPEKLPGQTSAAGTDEAVWTFNPASPNEPCPASSGCATWLAFRQSHPWPYQAIALEESNGEAVIILSEPPPVLTRTQYRQLLMALFASGLVDLTYCRWPTGIDGYLEDIVVRVRDNDASKMRFVSSEDLETKEGPRGIIDRLRLLYRLEYGTSDGFSLESVDSSPQNQAPIGELKIPVTDLVGWVASDTGQWRAIGNESLPPTTMSQLYTAKSPGAFVDNAGIVVLVVPKNSRLADVRAPFRRFAVASDLIIGARGSKNGSMLLFARSRSVPLSVLPPLRFESFAGFARNRAGNIAQSYERRRIFAGKIQTGKYAGWDWAPILLSPQLDDTEFGTLLNFADQILKSWSQHAEVEYYAFLYSSPRAYPFGDQAASEYFQTKFNTTSLLFNWNTDEFSTINRIGTEDYLTATRTGALRILYRPGDSLDFTANDESGSSDARTDADQKAQEAQDYFASLGNPILVRVVQNVLLYQAEQNFLTIADPQDQKRQARSDLVEVVLEQQATKWLTAAKQHKIMGSENAVLVDLVNRQLQESGMTPSELASFIASPQKVVIAFERMRELALKSARESIALDQQAEETSRLGKEAFTSACASVGGTLTKNQAGLHCEHRAASTGQQSFREADLLHAQMDEEEAAAENAAELAKQNELASQELARKYVKASAIAKTVTEFSGAADLDLVLAQVLQAGAGTAGSGFIRTPSVVLSKNVLDKEAIGGHNIDLIPRRTVTEISHSTTDAENHVGAPAKSRGVGNRTTSGPLIDVKMARPAEQALGKPRLGSLLEEMRVRASETPASFAEISARAKICNCDAIVSQKSDGTILFVRNAPPPIERVIFGKSGMIDALAAPPFMKIIEFENFDRNSVESLARTQSLLNSKSGLRASDDAFASIGKIFTDDGITDNGAAEILIAREDGEPESLFIIGGYDDRVSLKENFSWHGAQTNEASASKWSEMFGADTERDETLHARLIVRFGQAVNRQGVLGIAADGDVGFVSRLKLVVNQWLGRQPAQPMPISDSILDLRAAILTKLKPNHLQFYLKRNGGTIRAAQVDLPTGTKGPHT